MSTIGQRIRELRIERGLTQTQLAKGIVTPSMISQIEAGKTTPSQPLMERLAARLEVSIDQVSMAGTRAKVFSTLMHIVRACVEAGEWELAETLMADDQVADQQTNFEAMELAGRIHLAKGRLEEASASFSRALEIAREQEKWPLIPSIFLYLGQTYAAAEDWHVALHLYRQAKVSAERFPSQHGNLPADIAIELSRAYFAIGEREHAVAEADYARSLLLIGDSAKAAVQALARQAVAHLHQGEEAQAHKLAQEVAANHEIIHWLDATAEAFLVQIDQLLSDENWREADALITKGLAQCEPFIGPEQRAQFQLARGRFFAHKGLSRDALSFTVQALALCEPPTVPMLRQALLVARALWDQNAVEDTRYLMAWIADHSLGRDVSYLYEDSPLWSLMEEAEAQPTAL